VNQFGIPIKRTMKVKKTLAENVHVIASHLFDRPEESHARTFNQLRRKQRKGKKIRPRKKAQPTQTKGLLGGGQKKKKKQSDPQY